MNKEAIKLISFAKALDALKEGSTIRRAYWYDKFVYLYKGNLAIDVEDNEIYDGISKNLYNIGDYGTVTRLPNLNMKYNDSILTGWVPSQADMLSDDWVIDGDK